MSNKLITILLASLVISGCASMNKPPQFEGEYRPINKPDTSLKALSVYDFSFTGDLQEALQALSDKDATLNVLDAIGRQKSIPVRVNLNSTNTDQALSTLGVQTGNHADIIYTTSNDSNIKEVFIRYNN